MEDKNKVNENSADNADNQINKEMNESNAEFDEKEALELRREQQVERYKQQFQNEKEIKAAAEQRMKDDAEIEQSLSFVYSVRKVVVGICVAFWVFAMVALVTGSIEMTIFLPMCLFALAALALVNAPVFLKKDKTFDTIICVVVAAICLFLAARILIG